MLSTKEIIFAEFLQHPYAPVILSKNFDILPHQLSALYGVPEKNHKCNSLLSHNLGGLLRFGFPITALIADETGLGKTIIASLFIFSHIIRNIAKNIIIAFPKSLLIQWYEELLYKFGLYFTKIKKGKEFIELATKKNNNFKIITSIDLIKGKYGSDFLKNLPDKFIDISIIDEAHHVLTPKDTLRFRIAELLSKKSKSFILMSATPFRGNFEIENRRIKELLGTNFIYIRRFKDNVKDFKNNYIFPKRESYSIQLKFNLYWKQIYDNIYKNIDILKINSLAKLILKKLMASSIYTLKNTIENIKKNNYELKKSFIIENDDLSGIIEPNTNIYSSKSQKFENLNYSFDKLLQFLNSIIDKNITFKENEFLKILKKIIIRNKVVVFTEYRSTLRYLESLLKNEEISFTKIHGGLSNKKRKSALYQFWNDKNIKVLLATDAAGEGINLQIAQYQINFDIPWSPLKLEQRFGRLHRYGQKNITYVYNLAISGTLDDIILVKILKKLDNISKLLGDWIYDYIGIAINPSEIKNLILNDNFEIHDSKMIYRLQNLKKELHNPKIFNLNKVLYEINKIKTNLLKWLNVYKIENLNILNSIEYYKLFTNQIRNKKVLNEYLNNLLIGFKNMNKNINLFWVLIKNNNIYFDPIENTEITSNDAISYLKNKINYLASFYGYFNNDNTIEIFGDYS
ncbi:MAG: DEAD/DEAH box helicase [Candidatus Helarchaeota archaeon]